jgi:hypothetical protein
MDLQTRPPKAKTLDQMDTPTKIVLPKSAQISKLDQQVSIMIVQIMDRS